MSTEKCRQTLQNPKIWSKIRSRKGVLNAYVGNKISNKKDTGKPAIIILVEQKKPEDKLLKVEIIPKTINKCRTDVMELSTADYVLGDTSPSRRLPKFQKRIAGGIRNDS